MVEREAGDPAAAWKRQCAALERALGAGTTPAAADACCYLAAAAAALGEHALAATLLGAADNLRAEGGIEAGRPGAQGDGAVAALAASVIDVAAHRAAGRSLPGKALLALVHQHPVRSGP